MRLLDSGDYSPHAIDLLARAPAILSLIALASFALVLTVLLGQRQRLAALERVSMLDPLTGLMSGPYFDAERWPALVSRSAAPLAVLFVDLDELKHVNDTRGHAAGDRYIASAASTLRASLRGGVDHIVRLHSAGDEFLIVLSCASAEQARAIAEGLLRSLKAASISASIGVAFTARLAYQERAALRTQAEGAKQEAKRRGRGCVVLASPVARPEAVDAPASEDETHPAASGVPEPVEDTRTLRNQLPLTRSHSHLHCAALPPSPL